MGVRSFHLGDLLTITTGLLLSPRGMEGVYDILDFMTGGSLFTHQLPRAADECKPSLLAQHPCLGSPEVLAEAERFGAEIEGLADRAECERRLNAWLAGMAAVHGETFAVRADPPGSHPAIDPVTEAGLMMGKDRVVVVEVPSHDRSEES